MKRCNVAVLVRSVYKTWNNGGLDNLISSVFKRLEWVVCLINEGEGSNNLVETKWGVKYVDIKFYFQKCELTIWWWVNWWQWRCWRWRWSWRGERVIVTIYSLLEDELLCKVQLLYIAMLASLLILSCLLCRYYICSSINLTYDL